MRGVPSRRNYLYKSPEFTKSLEDCEKFCVAEAENARRAGWGIRLEKRTGARSQVGYEVNLR